METGKIHFKNLTKIEQAVKALLESYELIRINLSLMHLLPMILDLTHSILQS